MANMTAPLFMNNAKGYIFQDAAAFVEKELLFKFSVQPGTDRKAGAVGDADDTVAILPGITCAPDADVAISIATLPGIV